MNEEESVKKIRSIKLSEIVDDPAGILKGPKGPWPETQARVLELFIKQGSEPVKREELLRIFKGNRNPADKAIQLLNIRLKKIGVKIGGYQVYIIEPTEAENQLKLFN